MTLSIHGGKPVRTLPIPSRPQYGIAERNVANEVVASGNLSGFLADPGERFLGGPQVRSLENAWRMKFGIKHAVAMNSATSCLFGAVKALGIGPGDEVIVTPWSMSASATCVVAAGATPVFADIDPQTYCLDPEAILRAVTDRTKAIVVVDLFGAMPSLLGWDTHLPIIEDAAQAIGGRDGLRWAGTCGDIGVFSLNRHKTLQCGEGGVAVTDDEDLAQRLREYRNHGEIQGGLLGGNYRMGEIEAAIAEVQLRRLEELTEPRIQNAERLTEALSDLEGITPPHVPEGLRHVYYLYAVRIKENLPGLFHMALRDEGIPVQRYVKPLYHLPVFLPYGSPGQHHCEEAERAYREVVVLPHVHAGMTDGDVDDVIEAFRKVWSHREDL